MVSFLMLTFNMLYATIQFMKRYVDFVNQGIDGKILCKLHFVLNTVPLYSSDGALASIVHFDYYTNMMQTTHIFENFFNYNTRVLMRYGEYL